MKRHLYYSKSKNVFYVFKGDWSMEYAHMYPSLKKLGDMRYITSSNRPKLIEITHFTKEVFTEKEIYTYYVNESSILGMSKIFKFDYEDLWNIVYLDM